VAEHQATHPNVDTIGEQSASAFMPEVVPAEIDPLKLLAVPLSALSAGLWLDAKCEQPECFPGGLDVRLVRSVRSLTRIAALRRQVFSPTKAPKWQARAWLRILGDHK